MPKADQAERLVELETQVDKIKKQDYNRIHEEYSDLIQWLMMFYNTKHKIKEDDLKQIHATAENVHSVMAKVEDRENKLSTEREDIEKKLKVDKDDFKKKVQELSNTVKTLREKGGSYLLNSVPKQVQGLGAQIKDYNEKLKEINNKDNLLGNTKMEFNLLELVQKEMVPYESLWNLAVELENKLGVWKSSNIFKLDPEEIEKDVKQMIGQSRVLINAFNKMDPPPEKPFDYAKFLNNQLLEFNKSVPLLIYLCNEGLQDRHWADINKSATEAGLEININRETSFTLNQITTIGMTEIIGVLADISDRATKEFSNQKL